MSEKEFSKNENIGSVTDENARETSSSESDKSPPRREQDDYCTMDTARSSDDSSALEGAVGGEIMNPPVGANDPDIVDLNRRGRSALDRRNLNEGKLDIFRKFFNEDNLNFSTRPFDGLRQELQRPRRHSEGSRALSGQDCNPVSNLQPAAESVSNQAGAAGEATVPKKSKVVNCLKFPGFGYVADDRSIGSAETAPVAEVDAANFASNERSSASNRLLQVSSLPTSSWLQIESGNQRTSPLADSSVGDRHSPMSIDSESLSSEKQVEQRFEVSEPIPIRRKPDRSGSSAANAETSDFDGVILKRKLPKRSVRSGPLLPVRKFKDFSVDSAEQRSSKDEGSNYPELSYSVESDRFLPVSDLNENAAENLQVNLQALRVSEGRASESPSEVADPNTEQENDEKKDPTSILSCSPNAESPEEPSTTG